MAGPTEDIAGALSRLSIKDTSEDQSAADNVIEMVVKPYSTIEEIKANVALKFGIRSSEMRIFESGKQLANDKTLSDYTVLSGTTLQMSPHDMQIFVEHRNRGTKTVKVHIFETIENVKMKIEDVEGILFSLQYLRFNGQYLKDEKTLSDYGIQNNFTLQLVSEIRIFISFRGRKVSLSVGPSDTIETVKSKIKDDQGIPVTEDVCVHMNDQCLDNARTVADCDIHEQSVLQSPCNMGIFVKTLNGYTSYFRVCPLDTVTYLKMNIQRELGIPLDQYLLIFAAKRLDEDERTLAEYRITRGSTLHMVLQLRGGWQLDVETLTGKILHPKVSLSSDTIERVKMAIQKEQGIPADRQVLVYGGLELENRRRLLDLPDTRIQLILIPLRREIFVKTSPSNTVAIELEHTDTTENLKRKLEEKEGITPDRQRLVHAGKKLKAGRKISGYDIPNGATVELIKNTSINIQNWSGKKRTLGAVLEVDTARDVKSMIHERDRIVVEQQVLRFRGEELEDGNTLSQYKIQEYSTLELDMKDILIFIRRVGGRPIPNSRVGSDNRRMATACLPESPADCHNNTGWCVEAVIDKEGGTLVIPNTGVKLDIPRDAVLQRFNIRMKVIGPQSIDSQPRSFSSNSTTVVELNSERFKGFRRPAKLTLPHCLHLRKGFQQEANQVTVYESHHDDGTKPKWRENTSIAYILGDSDCTLLISNFSWKKYEVNDGIIEAKDITLYAAKQSPETPNPMSLLIDVGYYPGQLGSISKNITLNALTVLRQKAFKVYKKEEKPLIIAFEKSTPEGTWVSKTDEEVISFVDLVVNEEDSLTFELERPEGTTAEPLAEEKCHFKVSQETANNVRKADLIFYIRQAQSHQRAEKEPGVSEGNSRERSGLMTVVTDRQLLKLSTFITDKWKFVGRHLGLKEGVLDEISRDYVATGGVHEASYQMLLRWKCSTGSGGTVQKLADALGDSGLRDLQEKVSSHEFDT